MSETIVKRINFTENFDGLLSIWHACFPEDADVGERLLKKLAPQAEIFGLFTEDTLVSCAYCFKTTFSNADAQFLAYYVYGVGTLPVYRGNGFAERVLQYAKQSLNCDLLFLYPAQPSLRAFYERLGYMSMLYRSEWKLDVYSNEMPVFSQTAFSTTEYMGKRAVFLAGNGFSYATFSADVYETLLEHAYILSFDHALALCVVEDKTVILPEVICEQSYIDDILAAVQKRFSDKQVMAYLPGEEHLSGMVLPCSTLAKAHFNKQTKIPFFGTFFAE